jgi:rod shape-determining protein MreC
MESFLARYRNLVVLLVVLVAQITGLAVQVRRSSNGQSTDNSDMGGVRLIRLWANAVISPPEQFFHYTKLSIVHLWTDYVDLHRVREQNQQMQKTIDRLRLEQAALLEDARQGQRLQSILGFQQTYIFTTVAAQVYGSAGTDRSHIFYIDKGSSNGLKPDMAVITADGIVGKVRDVFPHTAQVLAVNDSTSGAGVILESTRIRGILRGDAAGRLEIVGIMADQRIQPGEHVLTAGGDLVFPRGLTVGSVAKIVRDPDRDGFIDILVNPSAHLDRLDEVLVITSTEPRFSPQQQQDITESESEKGAEAQAIKDQMKASEIMAEKLPGLVDPNLPADQQPLHDATPPTPALHPPQPLKPDRFTPGAAPTPAPAAGADSTDQPATPAAPGNSAAQPGQKTKPQTAPRGNP